MSGVQVSTGAGDSSAIVLAPPQLQQGQEVTVVTQFSPEAVDGITTSDSSGVVLAAPPQQQGQEVTVTQFSPEAVDEIIRRYKAFPKSEADELDEMRGWLMVLATLTASITYSAALNPPGGAWQADDATKGYVPGDPVFRDIRPMQYKLFYICNFFSFLSSLCIIAILSTPKFLIISQMHISQMKVCNVFVVLDIIALMGALTFGSARSTVDYVFQGIFMVLVLVYIILARVGERLARAEIQNA